MNLNNFSLLKEDNDSYQVAHPNGRSLTISKKGLSDKAHAAIKKMKVQHFDDGGITFTPESVSSLPETTQSNTPPQLPYQQDLTSIGNAISSVAQKAPELAQQFANALTPANSVVQPNISGSQGDPTANAQMLPPTASISNSPPPPPPGPSEGVMNAAPLESPSQPNMNGPFQAQKNANIAGAKAVAGEGKAENTAIQSTLDDIKKLPTQQEIIAANKAKDDQLFQAYQNQKIDPDRYWSNKSTGSKIAAGIGMVLSGFGGGASKQAPIAQQVIQNAINEDIDAQKNDQSKSLNLWKMNREALGNDLAANLATQNQMYTALKYKLGQAQAQFKGPQAMAQAQAANALIDQQMAQNNFKLSLMSGPTADNQDPSTRVQFLVPPGQQKDVFEEIKNAQNVTTNGPKMMQAFDNAANNLHAVDFIPGMQNVDQKDLHQLLLPNFKTIDGTVRQAAMDETFHNVTPQFGDSKETIAKKRQVLQDWMKSESAAPTAKGFGIDLSKFKSTSERMPQFREGQTASDSNGNRIVFKNGQWVSANG